MTPEELLDEVLTRFQVMYLQEPAQKALLVSALGMYQDKAGPIKTLTFAEDSAEAVVSGDFLGVATVQDAEGRWHEVNIVDDDLVVVEQSNSVKPYKLWYFVNMRGMDVKAGVLPTDSISVLSDYLHALIDIPNTRRAREVAATTGLQIETLDDATLLTRKETLEDAMEECQAIIPMATVY